MTSTALLLVLGAAVVHAGWNALAKRGGDPMVFLWCSAGLATLLLAPPALWAVAHGATVPAAAAPFVVATAIVHGIYFYALGRSYRTGDFSLVYPIARGLGVALVPVLAGVALGERLSPLGTAGVTLVVAGILTLQARPELWRALGTAGPRFGPGTGWALVTGLSIALYSVIDKAGVALAHPLPYIVLMGAGMTLLLLPAVLARREALRREWAANWRLVLLASTMNLTSYLLVLFAFRLSKVGYVVAAREISIVLSVLIGSLWFREGRLGVRLAAAIVVLTGVACIALAR
jgi:drug/metabolite transporter (DMT)-like permease